MNYFLGVLAVLFFSLTAQAETQARPDESPASYRERVRKTISYKPLKDCTENSEQDFTSIWNRSQANLECLETFIPEISNDDCVKGAKLVHTIKLSNQAFKACFNKAFETMTLKECTQFADNYMVLTARNQAKELCYMEKK